jgi:hypothetical protein
MITHRIRGQTTCLVVWPTVGYSLKKYSRRCYEGLAILSSLFQELADFSKCLSVWRDSRTTRLGNCWRCGQRRRRDRQGEGRKVTFKFACSPSFFSYTSKTGNALICSENHPKLYVNFSKRGIKIALNSTGIKLRLFRCWISPFQDLYLHATAQTSFPWAEFDLEISGNLHR